MIGNLCAWEIPKCGICLEDLIGSLAAAKCGHVYHCACLNAWMTNKLLCPTCRKPCRSSEVLPLNYEIGRKENDVYKTLCEKLSVEDATNVTQLHKQIIEICNELEQQQETTKNLQETVARVEAEKTELKEIQKTLSVALDMLKAKNEELHKQILDSKSEFDQQAKKIHNLSQANTLLEKEKNVLGRVAEIVNNISGGEGLDRMKKIRETESLENQAKEFYETCLVLFQQFANYRAAMIEYRQKQEKSEKLIMSLEAECKELRRATVSRRELETLPSTEFDKMQRRTHREMKSEIPKIVRLNQPQEQKESKPWTNLGKSLVKPKDNPVWSIIVDGSSKRIKHEVGPNSQTKINSYFGKNQALKLFNV